MKKYLTLLLLLTLVMPVMAETPSFLIADGSSSGIYQQMLKEILKVCGTELNVTEVPSHGAVDNLDKLISNEANAAFLHSDVIAYRAKSEDLSHVKTLLPLFPEDVHFVAKSQPYKAGGWKSYTSQGANLDTIADLDGLTVGAAGGGYITAQFIRTNSEIAYKVIQFDSGKEVMAALASGEIAAAVFVGAAPLPNLKELGKDYKILTIGDVPASKLKAIYRPSTVTYTNMSPSPVQTIAADALLVTREYKTPKFNAALRAFRACFTRNLDELKETPGTHKAWQKVDLSNKGKWAYYEFKQ